MDTIGYITDASVKVLPSEKLANFINDLEIQDDMPQSLQIFKGNTKIGNVHNEIKSNDSYMTIEDFALLKSLLKKSETDPEPQVKSDLDQSFSKTNDTKQGKNGVKGETNVSKDNEKKKEDTSSHVTDKYLYLCDLEWLSLYLTNLRKDNEYIYLHELLEGSDILLPENEVIKRNPVLEARCVRLRLEQSNRDYRSMTKNVDNVRARQPEESIAYQLKGLNRQLIAIGQFVISLGAGFLFGFLGIELMIGGLDFGFRLLLGVMCALIIALAEIYFLAKKLNEDLAIGETIQLGGPPVYPTKNHKEHKD